MGSLDNLKLYSDMTEEEKKAFHSAGGRAGGKAKARQRTFRETLRAALAREITVEQGREHLQALGYDGKWMDLLSQAQVEKASRGDTEAFRAVRDTIGESPRQGVDVGLSTQPVAGLDLATLSDAELRAMIEARQETPEDG